MKNLIVKQVIIGLFLAGSLLSCSEGDTAFYKVDDNIVRGAVLRTISVPSPTFNFLDTSSMWEVELEEQDTKKGGLFEEVELYVSHVSVAAGSTSAEVLLKTVPASAFSMGPNELPRGSVSASLTEVLNALSLVPGEYDPADQFIIRLVLVLTDGRTYTDDASAAVEGGAFFRSPFSYSVQFACPPTDASLFDGNYVVVNDAWADYSEGDIVPVEAVPGQLVFRIRSTNNSFISNSGTSYMIVTINPANGTVTVTSNECFDYLPAFGLGCLDVVGTGSVGTCTGDINLVLAFGGFTGNAFSLVKQ